MSETLQIPYIRWSDYKSHNPNKPDILELEHVDDETFPSELTENVKVKLKVDGNWEDRLLPLKSHESNNSELLNLWNTALKAKKLQKGKQYTIQTYMGVSKNSRAIRRYRLIL